MPALPDARRRLPIALAALWLAGCAIAPGHDIVGGTKPTPISVLRPWLITIAQRWHQQMTGGTSRSLRAEDVARAYRLSAQDAQAFIGRWDANRDGGLTAEEAVAGATDARSLAALKGELEGVLFIRSDADLDGRLSPAEASRVALPLSGGAPMAASLPLAITATEFGEADADRDGQLTLAEFNPLATKKTLERASESSPETLAGFVGFWIKTIPWSHGK